MPDDVIQADERLRLLSPKERECLRLVLENHSSKQIARQLRISHTSVDTHVRRARAKLGSPDRHQAAWMLAQWEQAGPDGPAPPAPGAGQAARTFRLPPLASLDFGRRLIMMAMGAVVTAAVAGLVMSVLAVL
jgi:DNA-binding CsgD family transcriptional regulator